MEANKDEASGADKSELLRLLNKAINRIQELADLKEDMQGQPVERCGNVINTLNRHTQGLLKLRPEIERERNNLLAEMNTERYRGKTDQSDQGSL